MPVKATIAMNLNAKETLTSFGIASNDATIAALLDAGRSLSGTTTPPVTRIVTGEVTLVAGAATIDLRALVGLGGGAVDGNGLKVQQALFIAKDTNPNPVTIAVGAANGYSLAGADFSVTLKPKDAFMLSLNDSPADIDGTHKTLDLTGTATEVIQYALLLG